MTGRGQVELVLFDFGGTLFHPAPPERLVAGAARRLNITLSKHQLAMVGLAYEDAGIPGARLPPIPTDLQAAYAIRDLGPREHRECWVSLLSRARLPEGSGVPDVSAMAEAIYAETLDPAQWVPYVDAASTLAELGARDIRSGLISNIGFDLREILHSHGFGALAGTATLSLEVGVMKPDPKIFRTALDRFGVEATHAVMVGDSAESDGGAADLGIPTLIIELTPAGTVHGLGRVLEFIDGLNS